MVSYEEEDGDNPDNYSLADPIEPRAPAPIYMLDLSKVRSYQQQQVQEEMPASL